MYSSVLILDFTIQPLHKKTDTRLIFLENVLDEGTYLILLLVFQDGLQESSALVAGGLLVEHAGLDDLLVHVELVFGSGQDLLLHAVHSAETQHTHLVLLPDTMGSILSLQVLYDNIEKLQTTPIPDQHQTMTERRQTW